MIVRLLVFTSLVLFGFHAQAVNVDTTFAIPQVSKIQRQMHGLAATATRTDRRFAGADYTLNKGEEKTAGVKTAEPQSSVIRPYAFYNFNNGFAVEGQLSMTKTEEDSVSGALKSDAQDLALAVGYALPDSPWAMGFALGQEETDEPTGGTDSDSDVLALSANMKMSNEMYLGFGIQRTNTDYDFGFGTAKADDLHQYSLAFGWVNGGTEKPVSAFETALVWLNDGGSKIYLLGNQYILNLNEQSQFHVDLVASYISVTGSDTKSVATSARYDYQINPMWYVAPEITLGKTMESGDDEITENGFGVEAGIRREVFAAFVSIGQSNEKLDRAASTTKTEEATLALGGHYYF